MHSICGAFIANPIAVVNGHEESHLWTTSPKRLCRMRPKHLTLRCSAGEERAPVSNSEWRSFRARLVRNERVEAETEVETDQLLKDSKRGADSSDKSTDGDGLWAHQIPHIEAGSLLLASPKHFSGAHACTFFAKTGILILQHSSEGTVGVILNRPLSVQISQNGDLGDNNSSDNVTDRENPSFSTEVSSSSMSSKAIHEELSRWSSSAHQTSLPPSDSSNDLSLFKNAPLYLGGPVGLESVAVLHGDPSFGNPVAGVVRSAPFDVAFEEFQRGNLKHARFYLGYSGWRHGQLKEEVDSGIWLCCSCCDDIILREWAGGSQLHRIVLPLMGKDFAEMAAKMDADN